MPVSLFIHWKRSSLCIHWPRWWKGLSKWHSSFPNCQHFWRSCHVQNWLETSKFGSPLCAIFVMWWSDYTHLVTCGMSCDSLTALTWTRDIHTCREDSIWSDSNPSGGGEEERQDWGVLPGKVCVCWRMGGGTPFIVGSLVYTNVVPETECFSAAITKPSWPHSSRCLKEATLLLSWDSGNQQHPFIWEGCSLLQHTTLTLWGFLSLSLVYALCIWKCLMA